MKKHKLNITSVSKGVLFCAGAAAVVSMSVGVSLAYLAANKNTPNEIKIDKGVISINEVFSEPSPLQLDNVTKKVVQVQNNGNSDCYVRVYVAFSDSDIAKKSLVSNTEPVSPAAQPAADSYITWAAFTSTSTPQTISPHWVYNSTDGYFYYTQKVPAGENTEPLFRWVKTEYGKQTAGGNDNEQYYDGTNGSDFIKNFEIIVYSESVQTVDMGNEVAYNVAWQNFLSKPTRTP